ncbi:hypothetical protein KI387_020212, partial [Taxus chinensis]
IPSDPAPERRQLVESRWARTRRVALDSSTAAWGRGRPRFGDHVCRFSASSHPCTSQLSRVQG